MCPLLLRPEPRFWLSTSEATGSPLCRSWLTTLISARRPADVGLTFINAICLGLRREVDFLSGLQANVGFFPIAPAASELAEALLLALDVDDLYGHHLDRLVFFAEHQLDRRLDFRLGRVLHDAQDDLLMLVRDVRALFRHDGRKQHRHQTLAVVLRRRIHVSNSSNCATAAFVSSTC